MGGGRRPPARATGPRCRGDTPVFAFPIDRRLRLCARVGTQHLFVVVRRRSCVVSGTWSSAALLPVAVLCERARCARRAGRRACARCDLSRIPSGTFFREVYPGSEMASQNDHAPATVRPLARDPRVLIGWPLPLGFGLGGCLLLARRGRVYV